MHPKLLTEALFDSARAKGAQLKTAGVIGFSISRNVVNGVQLDTGEVLDADIVVIAMGPWSGLVRDWFPRSGLPNIDGSRVHSIVLKPNEDITNHSIFLSGHHGDPEIYPRPDGTVYMCGESDKEPLPPDPKNVRLNELKCLDLQTTASKISKSLKSASLIANQSCYLPSGPDGLPIMGKLPNYKGAFIATGHTCWGILNAPASGLVMAEIILHGSSSCIDSSPFDPSRFLSTGNKKRKK